MTLRHVDPLARRGAAYRAICWLPVTLPGMWASEQLSWRLDPPLLRLTRGRFSTAGPLASALLETRGARSGQPRGSATLYYHDGPHVIIVASKQGGPAHPSWYHNLRADPEVVFGGLPFRAEVVADPADRNSPARLYGSCSTNCCASSRAGQCSICAARGDARL